MNTKGFSLIEIIVSITIFVIFATGYTLFLTQENVARDTERNLALSAGLITEAQETIRNRGVATFASGSWSMSTSSGVTTFFSGATIGNGSYVDSLGKNASQTGTSTFKRIFLITPGSTTYTTSSAKSVSLPYLSVSIQIWYPGCDFSKTACAYRNIMVY